MHLRLSRRFSIATHVAFLGSLALGGCELIATADRDRIGATGGASAGGAGGGGGESSCVADECPGIDTDCQKRACAGDTCTTVDEASGTTCTDTSPDAKVCDGVGNCVECVAAGDCNGDEICVDLFCVPATCANGDLDGDESDVDCGGSCAPCGNGDDCGDGDDCTSHFCDAGVCAPCTPGGSDCATTDYCNAGVCEPKLVDGDVCTAAEQCASGFCPGQDGVCCDTACDGTCEACLTAKNGGAGNGTCAVVPQNSDPDTECAANALLCRAANCNGSAGAPACNTVADGVVCRAGSGDSCDPDEVCAAGACPSDTFSNGSTVCRVGSGDSCDPDESCPGTAGMACPADVIMPVTHQCRPQVGDCDVADNCPGTAGGVCPDEVAAYGAPGAPETCAPFLCDGVIKDCPDFCDEDADCVATCNMGPNKCQ